MRRSNISIGFKTARLVSILASSVVISCCANQCNAPSMYSTAFYYGRHLPIEALTKYQHVVVEPGNTTNSELASLKAQGVMVYAYLSIGEVRQDSVWFKKLDKDWMLGVNKGWESSVMDLSNDGWRDFLIGHLAGELWRRGFKGFFLDTMDSYQLFTKAGNNVSAQQLGIITIIRDMKENFPEVHLLFNRGFEVLNEVGALADGIVAESLFTGWNPTSSRYQEVPLNDRKWLLNKLTMVRDKYKLPITVIDYLPSNQPQQAKKIARKISNLGFTPWVSTMELNSMGIGSPDMVR